MSFPFFRKIFPTLEFSVYIPTVYSLANLFRCFGKVKVFDIKISKRLSIEDIVK